MKLIISVIVIFFYFTAGILSQSLSWQPTNGPFGGYVRALAYSLNGNLFAGTSAGIFKSTDDGENWDLCSATKDYSIYSIAESPNGTIFAGTLYNDILRSTDEGNSWTQIGSNVYYIIDAMAVKQDGTIFAGVEESDGSGGGSIYRSTNNGNSWTEVNNGLPDAAVLQIRTADNGSVFAANIYGIYRSGNNGSSWSKLTNGISFTVAGDLAISPVNNYIYASGYSGSANSVFRSTNGGDSFTQLDFPDNLSVRTLDVSTTSHLFLGTSQTYPYPHYSIYRSTDDGESFVETDTTVSVKRFAFATPGQIFAGSNLGVHLSSNDGDSWELKVTGMNGISVNIVAADNANNIFAGSIYGPYRSTDAGNSWELTGNAIQLRATKDLTITSNGYIFAANSNGYGFRSIDSGENWNQLSPGVFLDHIFAASNDYLYLTTLYQGLFRSTDYGDTWTLKNSGLPIALLVEDFTCNSSGTIYIAASFDGIWKSTDNGDSWSSFSSYNGNIDYMASNESGDVFWSTSNSSSNINQLYRSTDNGSTYTQLTVVPGNQGIINDIFIDADQNVYVAVTDINAGGVYRSTNNGDDFENVSDGLTELRLTSLSMDSQQHLLAGTTRGVFRTLNPVPVELNSFTASVSWSDVVLNWSTVSETNNKGFEIQRSEAGDQRSEWEVIDFVGGAGTTTEIHRYRFTDEDLNAGNYNYRLKQIDFNGSFKYSSVVEAAVNVSLKYSLEQNYPNPFNPSTTIEFSLPENVKNAKLSIYNILGEKVAELVNGSMLVGKYQFQWNAKGLASGIYIYELRTEKFVSIRKMLLLK